MSIGRVKTSVTFTVIHRRRLALLVIVSLLACALMPASAAFFSAGQGACHSVSDDRSLIGNDDTDNSNAASAHHSPALEHEHQCDEATVLLTTDSVQLPISWWMGLSFLIVILMHQFAMHCLWRSGPRRYPPTLRSHLAIGRIQV